jgi:hypothetical protein
VGAVWVLASVVTSVLALGGCGGSDVDDTVSVGVLPRVVLDGTLEVSDRSGGRVIIEEVLAHAPEARVVSGVAGDVGDVVVDDDDPLLFHYALAERGGGDAMRLGVDRGGERRWSMPAGGGLLSVEFAPLTRTAPDVDAELWQHTAVVRGTIAITLDADQSLSPRLGSGFGAEGSPADVDPEGSPADVDPEGSPADVDPEGSPADVDPEGSPADAGQDEAGQVSGFLRTVVRVPFSLVLDGSFERSVVIEPSDLADATCGEVMPIDLHLSASELLDAEGLRTLEGLATAALARGDGEVTVHVSSRSAAAAVVVDVPAAIRRPDAVGADAGDASSIDVSGGRWRDRR